MESGMNLSAKQAECLKMMEAAPVVYLTNIDKDGFPSTRAMLNLKIKMIYNNDETNRKDFRE